MITIRKALLQASAVLTQPLRERLDTFTDPDHLKFGLRAIEATGLMRAIIDEGTSVLQRLAQDGGGCDVSPSAMQLPSLFILSSTTQASIPADPASVAEVDRAQTNDMRVCSVSQNPIIQLTLAIPKDGIRKVPDEYDLVLGLLHAFISARKDHCYAELDLLRGTPVPDFAPFGDDPYDMLHGIDDEDEDDPDLALAMMLSLQEQHDGAGPSTSMGAGMGGSHSSSANAFPACMLGSSDRALSSFLVDAEASGSTSDSVQNTKDGRGPSMESAPSTTPGEPLPIQLEKTD